MNWKELNVDDLDTACLDVQTRQVDWAEEGFHEYTEHGRWQIIYPPRECKPCEGEGDLPCKPCDGGLVVCPVCPAEAPDPDCMECSGDGETHCSDCGGDALEECKACDGAGTDPRFDEDPDLCVPMMNWAYPLSREGDYGEAEAALLDEHVCLTLVHDVMADNSYLALTGGGMDLSWEIAEAYILMGHLPPTFIHLPRMCGRGTSDRDRGIVAAMLKSYDVQTNWVQGRIDDLGTLVQWSAEYEAGRA